MYDILIIGSGPAGMTAGIYAGRAQMKTAILEKAASGGQMGSTWDIENYPGTDKSITGEQLSANMKAQCENYGVDFLQDTVWNIVKKDDYFVLETAEEKTYEARTIILALGADPRMLGVPGEAQYRGLGVSYCATCDANFFKNLKVAVVGGGDTALEEAIYLTKFASKVTLMHRRDEFRAAKILQKRVEENPKIDILYSTVPEAIEAGPDGLVNNVKIRNVVSGEISDLQIEGIFIFVGHIPNTDFVKDFITLNHQGYIPANNRMETSVPGVYAAGDVREKELRQIVTATSDGAIAAVNAAKYIEDHLE